MIDDTELARRSILGFGEMIASLGQWGVGTHSVVRRPDALGAQINIDAENPWFNGAVVPLGMTPPSDDPQLPYCLWTVNDSVPGRVEEPSIRTPCLGISLDDPRLADVGGSTDVGSPSLTELGDINERAYGQTGIFSPLVQSLRDDRIRTYGIRDGGQFVCVALRLDVGDDLSIQYVATESGHRRRGLASRLLEAIINDGKREGMSSATLQASPDGLSVYERLGFRRVATLRGYLRPDESE